MPATETLAAFGIEETAVTDRITGFVGLMIQPEAAAIRKAYELAAALMPKDAELVLAPGCLPHVTLTQCALRDVPRQRLATYIERLAEQLRGRSLPLSMVVAFGGGFLFWCVDPASPERAILQAAHENALAVTDGCLDPVANRAAVEGTVKLTNNDPVLVDYARTYGYAFVRDRYLPHITLGFDPRRAVDSRSPACSEPAEHRYTMTVERIVVAALGRHGRVGQVLAL